MERTLQWCCIVVLAVAVAAADSATSAVLFNVTQPPPVAISPDYQRAIFSQLAIPKYFSFSFGMQTVLSVAGQVSATGRGMVSFDRDDVASMRLVYSYRHRDEFVQESVTGFGPVYIRKVFARTMPNQEARPVTVVFPLRSCLTDLAVRDTVVNSVRPGPRLLSGPTWAIDCPTRVDVPVVNAPPTGTAVAAIRTVEPRVITLQVLFSQRSFVIAGFDYDGNATQQHSFHFEYVAAQQYAFPDTSFSRDQTPGIDAPCDFWMQSGQECRLTPARTSPTQLDVGRAEVNEKFNIFVNMDRPALTARLARRLLPIVIGPPAPSSAQRARYFIIDGHHQMAALNEASPGTAAPVYILCNWRHMNESDFWARMDERHWTFLHTWDGQKVPPAALPVTFADLGNSGYRALARLLVGRAVQKTCVPFAEFYWGSYLQNEGLVISEGHMGSLEDLSENYLDVAMWLARKPDASFLPGYVPLGNRVEFVHPQCGKKVCDLMDDVELAMVPLPAVAHCSLPGGLCVKMAQRFRAEPAGGKK